MLFAERSLDFGFTYSVEDVFGTITITSGDKLTEQLLDDIVAGILRADAAAGTITESITFTWKKTPQWLEDGELLANKITA